MCQKIKKKRRAKKLLNVETKQEEERRIVAIEKNVALDEITIDEVMNMKVVQGGEVNFGADEEQKKNIDKKQQPCDTLPQPLAFQVG